MPDMTRDEAQRVVDRNLGKPLTSDTAMVIQCVYGNYIVEQIADFLRRQPNVSPQLADLVHDTFIDAVGE